MKEKTGPIRVYIDPKIMDILPAYLKRRERDIERLQQFISIQDFDSIQLLGHKLFGNGSTFGFEPISRAGQNLESAAKEKDLSKLQEHTQKLIEYLANIEICPQE